MHQAQCSFCCLFDDENINTQSLLLKENGMLIFFYYRMLKFVLTLMRFSFAFVLKEYDVIIGNYHRLCELLDLDMINLKNVSYLVMDDFYRNRSARLSDEIKRVVNETRVSILFFKIRY